MSLLFLLPCITFEVQLLNTVMWCVKVKSKAVVLDIALLNEPGIIIIIIIIIIFKLFIIIIYYYYY